jgi:hypothetical protein
MWCFALDSRSVARERELSGRPIVKIITFVTMAHGLRTPRSGPRRTVGQFGRSIRGWPYTRRRDYTDRDFYEQSGASLLSPFFADDPNHGTNYEAD